MIELNNNYMKTRPRLLIAGVLTVLLSTFFLNASAQSFTGKVVDENDEPLAFANVVLHKSDSTFIAGTVTDTCGLFVISAHPEVSILQDVRISRIIRKCL